MILKDAVIVTVDFDGDIPFSRTGTTIFYGDGKDEECRDLVAAALGTMNDFYKKKYGKDVTARYGLNVFTSLLEIITNNELLDAFIEQGGDIFGNWEVTVEKV